jgi:hypothetical protein
MEEQELNRLLFLTIESIAEIATSRVSMWSTTDKYAHVPFFRFKFKDHDSKGDLYEKLGRAISNFKGNFVWAMDTHASTRSSYVIAPSNYIKLLLKDKSVYTKEDFMNKMPYEEYKQMVDRVIQDIPLLAVHISDSFG